MNAYYSKIFKNGAAFSIVYNINEKFGVEANAEYNVGNILKADGRMLNTDGSGSQVATSSRVRIVDFSCFVGPRYTVRTLNDKVTPFVHVMAGANRFRVKPSWGVGGVDETFLMGLPRSQDDGPALKVGAGFDVNVWKNLAVRAFQADFIWAKNHIATNPNTELSLKNVSFSAGVVYHVPELNLFHRKK
jgi:opacity protein-like surface antigen